VRRLSAFSKLTGLERQVVSFGHPFFLQKGFFNCLLESVEKALLRHKSPIEKVRQLRLNQVAVELTHFSNHLLSD